MPKRTLEGMYPDLDPPDEDDPPAFEREVFESFRALGWRPEDLRDTDCALRYAAWLLSAESSENVEDP